MAVDIRVHTLKKGANNILSRGISNYRTSAGLNCLSWQCSAVQCSAVQTWSGPVLTAPPRPMCSGKLGGNEHVTRVCTLYSAKIAGRRPGGCCRKSARRLDVSQNGGVGDGKCLPGVRTES